MGNIGSSFFATPQEKEFRKLTKKNTKVNRFSNGNIGEEPGAAPRTRSPDRQRRSPLGSLRFDSLITEVTYDREEGEIEVMRQHLNWESEDALGDELIKDLVPTTVPVVSAQTISPDEISRRRSGAILKRDSSFISAHAHRISRQAVAAHERNAAAAGSPAPHGGGESPSSLQQT